MTNTSFEFKPAVGQRVMIVKELFKDGDPNFPLFGLVGFIRRVYDVAGWETVDLELEDGTKVEGLFGIDLKEHSYV
jgi:hypothetical protein